MAYIKEVASKVEPGANDKEAKLWISRKIDQFIERRIVGAIEVITEKGANLIQDNDVILTYSRSVTVEEIFKKAAEQKKKFKVIIVEGRPDRSARTMMERLSKAGIQCIFTITQSVLYLIKDVTKVMLGVTSMLTNGALVGRIGTAMIACIAHSYHKPVIACCETYKFSPKVQFDSLSHNLMGSPDYLAYSTILTEQTVILALID
jgi:translation initiation factor eIF-2B subunit delta